ncbi:MAG: MATE family efflux transporter [Lachnospiraceae bacterium]|nr:MATE family efflux transporter [Lachnospiraceae bacterium]
MLVGSLYNIVDQFFIGRTIGELGNAATNIAFPLTISCMSIALLFGIGGAAAFNIAQGEKRPEYARHFMGTSVSVSVLLGFLLTLVSALFLEPMLMFFGSSEAILPYAAEYTRITSAGFPLLILTAAGGHLIRADGRPEISMVCNVSGAVINVILDYIFVFVLHKGMSGAAIATVIGQGVSSVLVIWFLSHTKTAGLRLKDLIPRIYALKRVATLGFAPCTNQLAILVVQIVLNNSLGHYGSLSVYGEDTPIAIVGIGSKLNMLFMSFIIGMSQSLQPIASYNYGARKFDRVRESYRKVISVGAVMAFVSWVFFMSFPRQIISIFGANESELYYEFAVKYFRIYLLCTVVNFMQPITSNFFTAIGKAKTGGFLALTRQIIFLLPLIVTLPLIFGIDGILMAGPVADAAAAIVSTVLVTRELKSISKL